VRGPAIYLGASSTEIDHDFLAWTFHQLCKSSGIDVAHDQGSVPVLPKVNCIGTIVIEAVIFDSRLQRNLSRPGRPAREYENSPIADDE
jgi:hypothetical protein